jgi:hypothetical protein
VIRDPRPGEAAVPKPEADPEFLVGNGVPQGPSAAEPLEGRPAPAALMGSGPVPAETAKPSRSASTARAWRLLSR